MFPVGRKNGGLFMTSQAVEEVLAAGSMRLAPASLVRWRDSPARDPGHLLNTCKSRGTGKIHEELQKRYVTMFVCFHISAKAMQVCA
jgi:hypothetical protein